MTATMKQEDQVILHIRRAQEGDREAFDELVGLFRERLETLTRSRVRPHLLEQLSVDELVNDTFSRAFESLERYHGEDSNAFFGWLAGIAKNVVLKSLRRLGRSEGLKVVENRAADLISPQ